MHYIDENNQMQIIGIIVDSLGEIPEISKSRIVASPAVFGGKGFAMNVIKPEPGSECAEMFVELNSDRLMECVTNKIQGCMEVIG